MPKLNINKINEFINTIPETSFEEVSNEKEGGEEAHKKEKESVSKKMMVALQKKALEFKEKPEWLNKLINLSEEIFYLTYLDKKNEKGEKIFTENYLRNEWPNSLYALAGRKIPIELLIKLCEGGIITDPSKPFTEEELNGEIGKIKTGEETIKDLCKKQKEEVVLTLDGIKNSIGHNKKEGLDLENTRIGKIVYQDYFRVAGKVNIILNHLAYLATRIKEYDAFASFNKKGGSFFIQAKDLEALKKLFEEFNEKFPDCAVLVEGAMIHGEIADGLTEEEFLNIIDPKILEKSNKVFKKEKQDDDKSVNTPVDTESTATPEAVNAEYEAKKAEIETRRQEELKRLSFDELMSEFEHNNHRLIGIRDEIGNSTFRIIDVSEEEQEVIIDYIKPDKTHSNFGLKIGSEETFKKYKEKYKEIEWSDEDIEAKYNAELAELNKKYNEDQEKTSEEESNEDDTENNTDKSPWPEERERELQEMESRHLETKAELAKLLELVNQLPDDEEEEGKENQKNEGEGNDEEKKEKATETPETKIDETEKDQTTYKKIMMEDFSWSFPNYINRFGEFTIGNKLSITVEEFTHEQVKRNTLGRILNSSPYKTVKLEKPFYELKITQEGSTKIYKLDNISQAIDKTDEVLSEYARKTASDLGEVTYIPYDYVKGSEKIESNIKYFINENILSAINKDRDEKPFLYFAVEKSNNSAILNITKNENTGTLDLRKLGSDWVGLERKFLITTAENEGFFEYNIFGFIKIIKNIKEIKNENGIVAKSDQAIYKIVGPNEEVIADNIQGYDEATKIYWEKTNEYKKVVEEEFNKLDNNKK